MGGCVNFWTNGMGPKWSKLSLTSYVKGPLMERRVSERKSDLIPATAAASVPAASSVPPFLNPSFPSFSEPPLVTLRHLHRKIASAATDAEYPHASTPPPQQKHIPWGDDTLELSITVGKQGGDGDMQISSLLSLIPGSIPGASGE